MTFFISQSKYCHPIIIIAFCMLYRNREGFTVKFRMKQIVMRKLQLTTLKQILMDCKGLAVREYGVN